MRSSWPHPNINCWHWIAFIIHYGKKSLKREAAHLDIFMQRHLVKSEAAHIDISVPAVRSALQMLKWNVTTPKLSTSLNQQTKQRRKFTQTILIKITGSQLRETYIVFRRSRVSSQWRSKQTSAIVLIGLLIPTLANWEIIKLLKKSVWSTIGDGGVIGQFSFDDQILTKFHAWRCWKISYLQSSVVSQMRQRFISKFIKIG